jgi:hypothetical protein
MSNWEEISEGCHTYPSGSWTIYLSIDDAGALLEVYEGTALITTSKWGPAITSQVSGEEWCKKHSLKCLEQEQKKRR